MQELTNPALALRALARECYPCGMLRWDVKARALLVCDAPRHGNAGRLAQALSHAAHCMPAEGGLLRIDLPESAYAAMVHADFCAPDAWHPAWFAQQSLLSSILLRPPPCVQAQPNVPLLRRALLACAQGEAPLRAFLATLAAADAAALRENDTASVRACAAYCALALWQSHSVGLPTPAWCDEPLYAPVPTA